MSRARWELNAVAGFAGVHVLRSGALGCAAIRLRSGGLCLFSPLPDLTGAAFAALENLGQVSILLAPNHYHHRGIDQHVARFPQARLVCSENARPRLNKLTGLDFKGLGALSGDLPPSVQILEPDGLKTGEVWLQVASDNDLAWIVCDCFSSEGSAPTMLGTFPRFGIRDRAVYKDWVTAQLHQKPPTTLIPCHGSPAAGPDLGTSLVRLLDAHVGPETLR